VATSLECGRTLSDFKGREVKTGYDGSRKKKTAKTKRPVQQGCQEQLMEAFHTRGRKKEETSSTHLAIVTRSGGGTTSLLGLDGKSVRAKRVRGVLEQGNSLFVGQRVREGSDCTKHDKLCRFGGGRKNVDKLADVEHSDKPASGRK